MDTTLGVRTTRCTLDGIGEGGEMAEDHIGTAEVARAFGVDVRTITRWEKAGKLPPATRTLGGHRRWRRLDIQRALKQQREEEAGA